MKQLTNFEITSFANSVRFAFKNIQVDYQAVRQSPCDIVSSKKNCAKGRGNAENFVKRFLLHRSLLD